MEFHRENEIKFVNVTDHERFALPLVLVKGFITNGKNKVHTYGTIITHHLDEDGAAVKRSSSIVHCGKFVILLNLAVGKNEILFKFEGTQSKKVFFYECQFTKFVVTPVFIVCEENDRDSEHSIEAVKCKILVGCRLLQALIAETLFQYGFGRKTFSLEHDIANKNQHCLIFRSKLKNVDALNMTSEELWEYFGREIMTSEYGFQNRKYLAFLSCNGKNETLAIGGGGLALCSAEYLRTWPVSVEKINECFLNDIDSLGFGGTNRNESENGFSASLGAVCHELCHTFDLGHTINGIMGRDFDRVNVMFSVILPQNLYQRTEKRQNFNCIKSKKDSLIICEGTLYRKLNINYVISKHSLASSTREDAAETGEVKNINELFPRVLFWSNGCATLLAYHRWLNYSNNSADQNENFRTSVNERILRYDCIRSIVTSEYGIVVVQLRNQNGYILKSWEFSERRKKTLFLVPICEARKACLIVVEDVKGNLLKKDILNIYGTDLFVN